MPSLTINQHDIQCINKVHGVKKRSEYFYQGKVKGSPAQYSQRFVDWLIQQHRRDGEFFAKARAGRSRRTGQLPAALLKTPKEQEHIEFLWDALETNCIHGKYQFAFLAYHILTMSFVYFNSGPGKLDDRDEPPGSRDPPAFRSRVAGIRLRPAQSAYALMRRDGKRRVQDAARWQGPEIRAARPGARRRATGIVTWPGSSGRTAGAAARRPRSGRPPGRPTRRVGRGAGRSRISRRRGNRSPSRRRR